MPVTRFPIGTVAGGFVLAVGLVWGLSVPSVADDSDEPTVPGFGVEETVPGFGPVVVLEELYDQKIVDYVDERLLGRYDANKNGRLDPVEVPRVPWGDDPKQDDRNGDGSLSREEMAARLVRRWKYGKKVPKSTATIPGFGIETTAAADASGGSTRLEDRYDAKVLEYVDENIIKPHDRNHNGVLEADEARHVRWTEDPRQDDRNGDGQYTREELADRTVRRWKAGASREKERSERRDTSDKSRAEAETDDGPTRLLTPAERYHDGLPGWFKDKDADADGQVAMREYHSQWTDSKVAEFRRFDLNGDGVITPAEALRADD